MVASADCEEHTYLAYTINADSHHNTNNNLTSTILHTIKQAPHMPPARGKGRSAITRLFLKKSVGTNTAATPPDEYGGNKPPASTDYDAARAMALEEAKKIIRNGGTQVEALAAAKEAARRAYSLRSGSVRPLTRGDDGEDCDLISSSSTSDARDEVALNQRYVPISYIGGQSDIVSVVTDPGKQEMIVNTVSKIRNSHSLSICDNVFQCLISFVDALDESIRGKSIGSVRDVISSVCSSGIGSGCGSTTSFCSGETGLLERGIDYKGELCCKEDSLHISGSTPLLCAFSRLSGSNTAKTAEEAGGSGAGEITAAVVVPGGGRHRPQGTLVSATEKKSDDERRMLDAKGEMDYNPNWRDNVADTVVTAARAVNANASQCHMQQQQQINLPGESCQTHPGAAPHSSIAQFHPLRRSMSRINQDSQQHMPQGGIGKRSRSSHDEYYRNSVGNADGGWQYPERAPNNAVRGEEQQHHHSHVPDSGEPYSIVPKININSSRDSMGEIDERIDRYLPGGWQYPERAPNNAVRGEEQQHHHSHVPDSGEPYSIVPKININSSKDSMDEIDERIDRYKPACAGGVSRQGDRMYC